MKGCGGLFIYCSVWSVLHNGHINAGAIDSETCWKSPGCYWGQSEWLGYEENLSPSQNFNHNSFVFDFISRLIYVLIIIFVHFIFLPFMFFAQIFMKKHDWDNNFLPTCIDVMTQQPHCKLQNHYWHTNTNTHTNKNIYIKKKHIGLWWWWW